MKKRIIKLTITTILLATTINLIGCSNLKMIKNTSEERKTIREDCEVSQKSNKVEVENISYESDGNIIVDFTNGSWCIVNQEKGIYKFQPTEMGDYDYTFNDLVTMQKAIKTYLLIQNEGSY